MSYFIFKLVSYTVFLLFNLFLSFKLCVALFGITGQSLDKYLWMLPVYLLLYFFNRLFTFRTVNSQEFVMTVRANLLSLLIVVLVLFSEKAGEHYSRSVVFTFFMLNNLIPVYMYFTKRIFMSFPFLREPVIVICDKEGLENIRRWFVKDNAFGFDVKRIIKIDNNNRFSSLSESDLKRYYAMVIAASTLKATRIFYLIDRFQPAIKRIIVLPSLAKMPVLNFQTVSSINHRGLALLVHNNLLNPVYRFTKNAMDLVLSSFFLIFLTPVIFIIYIAVFIDSKGHPIFAHERVGYMGKRFKMLKFRTMRLDGDRILKEALEKSEELKKEWSENFKLKDDPRVTRLGRFLRKTSLDELPQFFNILKGEMSLVGPRPIVEEEIKKYGEYFDYYKLVKPGITGLWQVSGRNDVSYSERVMMDVWYVRNWSVGLDIVIILKTIYSVLSLKGSY